MLQVIDSEEFLLLPVTQLMDIISSDELNVRSEEQVYSAVMLWTQHNIQERRPHLGNVGGWPVTVDVLRPSTLCCFLLCVTDPI